MAWPNDMLWSHHTSNVRNCCWSHRADPYDEHLQSFLASQEATNTWSICPSCHRGVIVFALLLKPWEGEKIMLRCLPLWLNPADMVGPFFFCQLLLLGHPGEKATRCPFILSVFSSSWTFIPRSHQLPSLMLSKGMGAATTHVCTHACLYSIMSVLRTK